MAAMCMPKMPTNPAWTLPCDNAAFWQDIQYFNWIQNPLNIRFIFDSLGIFDSIFNSSQISYSSHPYRPASTCVFIATGNSTHIYVCVCVCISFNEVGRIRFGPNHSGPKQMTLSLLANTACDILMYVTHLLWHMKLSPLN